VLHQVECISLCLCLKLQYPKRVTLLRGNHEARQVSQVYGFYDECMRKYGSAAVWQRFVRVFDLLPIAALVNNEVFCPHAGLSPAVDSLDQVQAIQRMCEVPHEGPLCDLLWSDPDSRNGWGLSPRGAGYTFGPDVTAKFVHTNGIAMVARAHQLVMEGYTWNHEKQCATVFSAPNYCYRCGNKAAIMLVDETGVVSFLSYNAAPTQDRRPAARLPDYFL